WVSKLLVGPWFTSLYRIGTGSDWIFRRGLAGAYPNHPAFTRRFLDQWERPFKVRGTLDALRSMLQYGIQGFRLAQLRAVRVPAGREDVRSCSATPAADAGFAGVGRYGWNRRRSDRSRHVPRSGTDFGRQWS